MSDDDGLVTTASSYSVAETIDRLQGAATAAGLNIFGRVDHAAGAARVEMELRPTELLIFGNPQGGTPLMQANQTAGIDLPIKALAWEDERGQVWLTYNDPSWIARRHRLGLEVQTAVDTMSNGLAALAAKARGGA